MNSWRKYSMINNNPRRDVLNELADKIWRANVDKGFWDRERDMFEIVSLVMTELGEAIEEYRRYSPNTAEYYKATHKYHGRDSSGHLKPEGVPVEMADALIRILDWFGSTGLDLDTIVAEKLAYNATRPHKHGKNA